jgi:NADH-quinone oxidoreductase subunit A
MTPVLAGQSHFAEYGSIAVIAILTAAVVFTLMSLVRIITRVFSRIQTTPGKLSTYECGETPIGPAWFQFNNRFYLVAILFLIFDVEVALIMPVLVRYTMFLRNGNGVAALVKIILFAGTLLLGLVYAARKGDLSWNKSIRVDQGDSE